MTIHYLKKLEANPIILDTEELPYEETAIEGCTIEEIEMLEGRLSKKFPTAYREFLFLAGKENCLMGNGVDYSYDELEEIQAAFRDHLKDVGFIIPRGFWAIDMLDGEQFHFFYFDEGDNPPVYHFCAYFPEEDGYNKGIRLHYKTFSQMIEGRIPSGFLKFYNKTVDKVASLLLKPKS